VILAADPLADIANVDQVERVVAYGFQYDPRQMRGGK